MTPPSSAADAASHPDDWMNMLDHIMEGYHHHESTLEPLVQNAAANHREAHTAPVAPNEKLRAAAKGHQESEHPGASQSTSSKAVAGCTSNFVHVPHRNADPRVSAAAAAPVASRVVPAPVTAGTSAAPTSCDTSNRPSVTQLVASASAVAAVPAPFPAPPTAPPTATGASTASASAVGAAIAAPVAVAEASAAIAAETAATKPVSASATSTAASPAPAPPAVLVGKPGSADESEAAASGGDSEFGVTPEARAQARSERKRTREKQRRSDVNAQFASLTALLRKIEQEDLASDDAEQRVVGGHSIERAAEMEERKSTLGFLNTIGRTGCPTNRADLIAMTICVLERMHAQNGRMRKGRRELQRELAESKRRAEDLARKHKEAEAAAQQAALGAAHAAAMPKQDKVMMMVPMMVTPDQVAGVHNATHGMQMPFPFMPPHMSPAAAFVPQMQPQPQPPAASSGSSQTVGTPQAPLSQPTTPPSAAATTAPAPKPHTTPHPHPAPQAAPAPLGASVPRPTPMMPPGGIPMMMPSTPGGFFFNSGKLPAHPVPMQMPNMMMPSTIPPANPLQQPFSAAAAATTAPVGQPHHLPSATSSSHPPPPQQAQPPQSHLHPLLQPAPGMLMSEAAPSLAEKQQKSQAQATLPAPTSPSLHGGTGSNQFPPPPPGGAPGGSSGGSGGASANGGGGGNLAHCA